MRDELKKRVANSDEFLDWRGGGSPIFAFYSGFLPTLAAGLPSVAPLPPLCFVLTKGCCSPPSTPLRGAGLLFQRYFSGAGGGIFRRNQPLLTCKELLSTFELLKIPPRTTDFQWYLDSLPAPCAFENPPLGLLSLSQSSWQYCWIYIYIFLILLLLYYVPLRRQLLLLQHACHVQQQLCFFFCPVGLPQSFASPVASVQRGKNAPRL